MRTFLTARWMNLGMVTYRVPGEVLLPFVPRGCALDRPDPEGSGEDHGYLSLVGFDFLQTRVLGIGWPGLRDFPELNLRTYVRSGARRGVVFIREFVPRMVVAGMARWLYNEPYEVAPMTRELREFGGEWTLRHTLRKAGREHRLEMRAGAGAEHPSDTSIEHFFKDKHWGFGTLRSGRVITYEVQHPDWDIYPVREVVVGLEWAEVFGSGWSFLQDATPYHVMLARGSDVTMFAKQVAAAA